MVMARTLSFAGYSLYLPAHIYLVSDPTIFESMALD